MVTSVLGMQRWSFINASPETVFTYLTDLPRHADWDDQTGFTVVRISDGPVVEGSFCDRERLEIFQAPILRGGVTSSQVSWIKRLTVVGCEPHQALDFETKNLYNGLSVGSEYVSFRLFPKDAGTVLVMTDKKSPQLPGLFHLLMMIMEMIKSVISRPIVGFLYRVFPGLRLNKELSRIKQALEQD
ncbi:MAG: SRPBCC family protein [SAR202 cluster bacterium]|jgi:hypothetical protein|nr:SRPBCC family protein [SAR202 cluster bacterium]|tara:strand:+ start:6913 stop:7470 length:558 start_codon:yes stop_codon:yes gene_type:complete